MYGAVCFSKFFRSHACVPNPQNFYFIFADNVRYSVVEKEQTSVVTIIADFILIDRAHFGESTYLV